MAAHADTHHRKSPAVRSLAAYDGSSTVAARRPTLLSFYAQALRELSARPNRLRAVLFLVASALHSFGHAALALAAGRCAVLLAGSTGNEPSRGLRTALLLGSIGLAAALAKGAGGVAAAYGQARIASRVGGMLRLEVLDRWFARYRLRRPRQDDHGHGSTTPGVADGAGGIPRTAARGVSALTVRVREVETGLSVGLLGGGRALAQLIPLAAALVWISPKLALVAFGVLAPFGLILSRVRRNWKSTHHAAARQGEALLEAADEAVRHADLWVAYSAETKARAVVAQLGEMLGAREARIQASSAAMSGGNEVLGALALVLALAAGAGGYLGEVGGGGRLLAFTVCFFLAYRPIRDLTEARLAWSRAALAFADLNDGEGGGPVAAAGTDAEPGREWPLEALRVEGAVLRHGTEAPISFTLAAGEVVVVVGATGEGKTTLLRALLGLDTLRAGDVRYGSASLGDAPPGLAQRPFAWVPQDSALLTDTLEANVTLGAWTSPSDVRRVLALLGAEPIVDATGDRRLGPFGVAVSGGERQWIALARALSTRQPVLLLDEPTSGLDPASQSAVLYAVAGLRGARSVVLVTHRAEPLALADVIVRLDGDEVRVTDGPMRLAGGSGVG
jgi:ABC-type multidrug transport system fused ATPase/permease subunit